MTGWSEGWPKLLWTVRTGKGQHSAYWREFDRVKPPPMMDFCRQVEVVPLSQAVPRSELEPILAKIGECYWKKQAGHMPAREIDEARDALQALLYPSEEQGRDSE